MMWWLGRDDAELAEARTALAAAQNANKILVADNDALKVKIQDLYRVIGGLQRDLDSRKVAAQLAVSFLVDEPKQEPQA